MTCSLSTHTLAVPSYSPTDFTYQSSSIVGDSIILSLSWTYPTPNSDNASCQENVLGYSLYCKDVNSMFEFSQVALATSDSQQQQHHFTAEVALWQDLGALLSGINCTVFAFNAAGTGESSEEVFIDLTGFFISSKCHLRTLAVTCTSTHFLSLPIWF